MVEVEEARDWAVDDVAGNIVGFGMFDKGLNHTGDGIVVDPDDIIINLQVDGIGIRERLPDDIEASPAMDIAGSFYRDNLILRDAINKITEPCQILWIIGICHEEDLVQETAIYGQILLQVAVENVDIASPAVKDDASDIDSLGPLKLRRGRHDGCRRCRVEYAERPQPFRGQRTAN